MEIPLDAQVECTDGVCGTSAYVLINPVAGQITHLVVRVAGPLEMEYLVPVDLASETIEGTLQLSCSRAELEKLDPFVKTEFVEEKVIDVYLGAMREGAYGPGMYYWPYVSSNETVQVPEEHQQIPAGELAVRRGTRIEATDGPVGRVDEFVIDAQTGGITHLVMREGHLWGQKDVIIPLSAIGETQGDTIRLKLDKHQIESLPNFRVRRHWG